MTVTAHSPASFPHADPGPSACRSAAIDRKTGVRPGRLRDAARSSVGHGPAATLAATGTRFLVRHLALLLLLLACRAQADTPAPSGREPAAGSVAASAGPGMLSVGGRWVWEAAALEATSPVLEATLLVRPLPRALLFAGWGRASRRVRVPEADTLVAESRIDATGALVLLPAPATIYLPVSTRRIHQEHSFHGDADWWEYGVGLGVLAPQGSLVWWRLEGLWRTASDHDDRRLGGDGRRGGSGLELSAGFLLSLR